jgi:Bacterial PH domain
MTRWHRPHGVTDDMVYSVIAMSVFVLVGFLAWWSNGGLGDGLAPLAGYGVVVTFVVLYHWRWNRVGVFVGDEGIRVRSVWRTRTLPWNAVARIETGPIVTRLGSRPPGEAVWIRLHEGEPVQTRVVLVRDEWSFLIGGWRTGRRCLSDSAYRRAMQRLIDAHRRSLGLAG